MSSGKIEFRGMDDVLAMLDDRGKIESVQKALEKACMVVVNAAVKKAPKGDGILRRTITFKVEDLEGIVYTPLEYAPYVEYGTGLFAEDGGRTDVPWKYEDEEGNWHSTSGMQPRPFLRPALDESREEITRIIAEGLVQDD
jgi:HK97 gp10 family phage protein